MTQTSSLVMVVTLLLAGLSARGSSVTWPLGPGLQAPPASFGPDHEHNGPSRNGAYVGQQGPTLNGWGAPGPMVRGLAVEGLELPDGTRLGR